jgi:argininosuccinate lyase
LKINRERMEASAGDPALFATDVAEHLVKSGVAFREAHELVGRLVRRAAELNVPLHQLSRVEAGRISPHFDFDLSELFDARASLAKRTATGAPSPANVTAQLDRWRTLLR